MLQLKQRDRVIFIPLHAKRDRHHPDCERGMVSSVAPGGTVYVKFNGKIARYGWEQAPAEACDPENLAKE